MYLGSFISTSYFENATRESSNNACILETDVSKFQLTELQLAFMLLQLAGMKTSTGSFGVSSECDNVLMMCILQ